MYRAPPCGPCARRRVEEGRGKPRPYEDWAFGVGGDAAGDAGWGCAFCATGNRVDDDGAIAEVRVVVVAEGYGWRDDGDVGSAVSADDQGKIRDVAGGHSVVSMFGAARIEVRASGFEIGRIAFCDLVNVQGVFTRGKILDVQRDFDAFRSGR